MDNRYQIGFKGKRYGLIMPSKGPAAAKAPRGGAMAAGKAASVFAAAAQEDDHDTDDQGRGAAKKAHREAEAMDANIFDYDLWKEKDAQTQERQEVRRVAANATKAKPSKYVAALKKKAEARKREQDRIYERRVLKEREKDDHMFEDKEKFMTAAYKRKLEEDKQAEEEERRKEAQNAAGGMKGFFTNIIEAQTGHDADRRTLGGVTPAAGAPAPARDARPAGNGGGKPGAEGERSGPSGGEELGGAGISTRKRQRGASPPEQSSREASASTGREGSAVAAAAEGAERTGAAPEPTAATAAQAEASTASTAAPAGARPPGVTVAPPAAESEIEAARRRAMERMKRRRKQ